MRIGFSRPGSAQTVRRMVALLETYGFVGIQLKEAQYLHWRDRPEVFVAEVGRGPVMGLIVIGAEPGSVQTAIQFAATTGMEVVTWVPTWPRGTVHHAGAVEQVEALGTVAQRAGVRLSLHPRAGSVFQDEVDLEVFRLLVPPEAAGVTFDTGQMWLAGVTDLPRVVREYGEIIDLFHLKDVREGAFCPLGQGEIDFDALFEAIAAIDFQGWLIVDDQNPHRPLEQAMAEGASFVQERLHR